MIAAKIGAIAERTSLIAERIAGIGVRTCATARMIAVYAIASRTAWIVERMCETERRIGGIAERTCEIDVRTFGTVTMALGAAETAWGTGNCGLRHECLRLRGGGTIGDCLTHMSEGDVVAGVQIGDGAGHAEDAVIRTR